MPRILVVDDEPEVRELLRESLCRHGFAVRTAASARQALGEAKRWMPRALIVDLVMPGLGGLDTVERIRSINPAIAIVVISGRVDAADRVARAGLAVTATFAKPLDLWAIVAALHAAGVGPAVPPADAEPAEAGRPKRILVVDDEPDVRGVLAEYLERKGFEVVEAGSGEEALARAREARPGLVLLDIALPGLGGIDALRELRSLWADTPVVMVSGTADVDTARQSLTMGAADYIPKPVDFGYLDSVLDMHAPAAPTA